MTAISLPFPPSANSLYRAVGGRAIMSKAYRAWKTEAGSVLLAQRPERHSGLVDVSVEVCAPDRRRRDIDNRLKPLLDLLKTHGVIVDDDSRYVRGVSAFWVKDGPACLVRITPVGAA